MGVLLPKPPCWNRFPDNHSGRQDLWRDAIRGPKATVTATALEHPDTGSHDPPGKSSGCLPAPGKISGDTHRYSTRWEEHPTCKAVSAHHDTRHFPQHRPNLWMRPVATTQKRMQDSDVNFLRWTCEKRVSRALHNKNTKAEIFLPRTYVY